MLRPLPTHLQAASTRLPAQDYSHASVTAETFLAVLAGNASGVPPPSRHSSGRVLQAGPQDKVFVYYRCGCWRGRGGAVGLLLLHIMTAVDGCAHRCAERQWGLSCRLAWRLPQPPLCLLLLLNCSDHGAPGILGMPSGPFLYAGGPVRVGAGLRLHWRAAVGQRCMMRVE